MIRELLIIIMILSMGFVYSQSQMEMNIDAKKEYESVDSQLNEVYNQILTEYADNKDFIKNLRASERLWIKFRDAELLMKFPKNSEVRNGSVFPVCYYSYLTNLTEQRTTTLNQWILGEPEGEVCSGSILIN